jgi:hypothetical protein
MNLLVGLWCQGVTIAGDEKLAQIHHKGVVLETILILFLMNDGMHIE